VLQANGSSHAATLPALRRMHLNGYYVLAPWSDVCIILRMLLQLGHVLVRLLAEIVLRLGYNFDRVPVSRVDVATHVLDSKLVPDTYRRKTKQTLVRRLQLSIAPKYGAFHQGVFILLCVTRH